MTPYLGPLMLPPSSIRWKTKVAADPRTKYLQKLGHSWYVRIKVPPALQKLAGNTHIRRALHTRSLDEANVLKWPVIARIKRELEQLKRSDPEGTKAQLYRDQITEARNAGDHLSAETLELLAVDDAEKLHEATGSLEKARAWYQLATVDGKSLTELLDEWLDSSEYKAHTKDKHRKAFEEFKVFMGGDCLPSAVTDKVALDYVDDHLRPQKLANRTKSGKLMSLSAFWNWLGSKLYVPKGHNPWKGHKMASKVDHKRNPDKRPYTDEELVKLLSGFMGADKTQYGDKSVMPSIVLLALYTGAREEEICSLKVDDIDEANGAYFVRVQDSKTKAGVRELAISHPVPVAILKHRLSKVKEGHIYWPSDVAVVHW